MGMDIVAYDSEGFYSAARVWWTFRAMGHESVRGFNGGLKKGRPKGVPGRRRSRPGARSATSRRLNAASYARWRRPRR